MEELFLENEYAEFKVIDGIIHETFKPDLKIITIEVATKIVETRFEISNGIWMPIFIDLTNAIMADKQSRQYWSQEQVFKYLTAIAVLVKNEFHRMGISFYIHFDKPAVPTKSFVDKEKAINWLARFKNI